MSDPIFDIEAFIEEVAKFGVSTQEACAGLEELGEALQNDPWFSFMFGERKFYEDVMEMRKQQ